MDWNDANIERLRVHLAAGMTQSEIALAMCCTKPMISGAIRRHIGNKPPPNGPRLVASAWDEERLTERWEDRKARRAAERELCAA